MRLSAALRFAAVAAVVAPLAALAFGGCGPNANEVWLCLDPVTGKESNAQYDPNHYVNGVFDPCHCYDPCGPQKTCPDVVDAGPLPPGCPAGDGGT